MVRIRDCLGSLLQAIILANFISFSAFAFSYELEKLDARVNEGLLDINSSSKLFSPSADDQSLVQRHSYVNILFQEIPKMEIYFLFPLFVLLLFATVKITLFKVNDFLFQTSTIILAYIEFALINLWPSNKDTIENYYLVFPIIGFFILSFGSRFHELQTMAIE